MSILELCYYENSLESIKLVLANIPDYQLKTVINEKDDENVTLLMWECSSINNIEIIKYLIDNGANVNDYDKWGTTPLMMACKEPLNFVYVEYLIEHGANVNAWDIFNLSPLIFASYIKDNIEIIEYLIAHGANVNDADYCGNTALINVCLMNPDDVKAIKCLIINGANINIKPLIRICYENGCLETVKYLIEKGVQSNIGKFGLPEYTRFIEMSKWVDYDI